MLALCVSTRHCESIRITATCLLRDGSAGEGNRTPVCSLGSCRSTIELHPRRDFRFSIADSRFASSEQSLPGNYVAGTGEIVQTTTLGGKSRRWRRQRRCRPTPQCAVLTKRPRNNSVVQGLPTRLVGIRIYRKLIVVIAIDLHIIWRSPRIVPDTGRRLDA